MVRKLVIKFQSSTLKKLIIVDIDEYRLSLIIREILNNNKFIKNKYFNYLVDINNFDMIHEIFKKYKPDIVYHAAASKHVDLVEIIGFTDQ